MVNMPFTGQPVGALYDVERDDEVMLFELGNVCIMSPDNEKVSRLDRSLSRAGRRVFEDTDIKKFDIRLDEKSTDI